MKSIQPHFMLVPSLFCPASCIYCFGPHKGPIMDANMMEATVDFITRIVQETGQRKVKVTFHGGEPLMAGHETFHQALDGLTSRLNQHKLDFAIQSNLWLLDDKFCKIFAEYKVDVGSSLDGPEHINDKQRGKDYFKQTTESIRKARSRNINVGCIATFTNWSVPHWREVFDFFMSERLNFSIHPAVPALEQDNISYPPNPEQYGDMALEMLDHYIKNRREISISSLDQMCQGVAEDEGKVCTFRDCLGMFLAIDPNGDVFPCQRFCGRPDYRLGNIADNPTLDDLMSSPFAQKMAERERKVREVCKDCQHIDYCKGGCAYNALSSDNILDPYCPSYLEIFDYIKNRLNEEMASEENINAIAERPYNGRGHPLLKKGPLIDIAKGGTHPHIIARTAKRIVASVELAKGPDIPTVTERLLKMGIARTQESGEYSLLALQNDLKPKQVLNNLYLHVTFRCQLECTHCYARADAYGRQQKDMPVDSVISLAREAKNVKFRQVIITGGEPLVHSQRDVMLDKFSEMRSDMRPVNIVLRTNLAMPLNEDDLYRIASAFDQVVISVDGNEKTHDERRGKGSYAKVLRNLEAYANIAKSINNAGELSLAAVMRADDIQGEPGISVNELAKRLGVKRTRFRPLLPLGRALDWDEPPISEALGGHSDPMELIENGFRPISSCGLGQNLYVEPSGQTFPCYAYHKPHTYLGNVLNDALNSVLQLESFKNLSLHNVDTNIKCCKCELRYLCGGACRAWGKEATQYQLDTSPPECEGLKKRANNLLIASLKYLEIGEREDKHV
jgi:uncharacterized protein